METGSLSLSALLRTQLRVQARARKPPAHREALSEYSGAARRRLRGRGAMTPPRDCHRHRPTCHPLHSLKSKREMRPAQPVRTRLRARLRRIQIVPAFRRAQSSPDWDHQKRGMYPLRQYRLRPHQVELQRLRVRPSPVVLRQNLAHLRQPLHPTPASHQSWSRRPYSRMLNQGTTDPVRQ